MTLFNEVCVSIVLILNPILFGKYEISVHSRRKFES
jgi:hypothetical protein